jgi:hypothetical protein
VKPWVQARAPPKREKRMEFAYKKTILNLWQKYKKEHLT